MSEQGNQVAPLTRMLFRVGEVVSATGISKTKLYELMAAGDLDFVLIGRARYIPADALQEFVARLRRSRLADVVRLAEEPPPAEYDRPLPFTESA